MSGRSRDSGRDSRGGNGKGSFNFPQWNYGYTIGPASQATAGDYSQFFVAQPGGGESKFLQKILNSASKASQASRWQ